MSIKGKQKVSATQLLLFVLIYAVIVVIFLVASKSCLDRAGLDRAGLWTAALVGALAPVAWYLATLLNRRIKRANRKDNT